jgi:predicted RNase H-like nuclease (RuvC/YqgF family)
VEVKRLEGMEKRAKTNIFEKDQEIEELEHDHKRELNRERKKIENLKEQLSCLRDAYDKKKTKYINNMLEKDEKIIKLTREVRDQSRKINGI